MHNANNISNRDLMNVSEMPIKRHFILHEFSIEEGVRETARCWNTKYGGESKERRELDAARDT